MKHLVGLLAVAGLFVLNGCTPKTMVTRIAPAEIALPGIEKIGLLPFDGRDGAALNSSISEKLVDSERFTVLDRETLDLAQEEMARCSDGSMDCDEVADGETMHATALLSGEVIQASFQRDSRREKATCYRSNGNGKSTKYSCTKYFVSGKVHYIAKVKLVKVTTGAYLASKNLDCVRSDSNSSTEGRPPAIDGDRLLSQCRGQLADELFASIAPHTVREQVILPEDGSLPTLETGNLFAKKGQWSKATGYYTQALKLANTNQASLGPKTVGIANYAVALGKAMEGNFEDALAALDTAIGLQPKEEWIDFQIRVQQWQSDAETLTENAAAVEGEPLSMN